MRAIVLAAGVGSRLKPLTLEKPKALVEVNGRPILYYILRSLESNNIKDIVICTGFNSAKIESYCIKNHPGLRLTFVENKDYASTNNMYSLYLAKDYLDQDIFLMNGDVVFSPQIISAMLLEKKSCIAVDVGNYIDESMKVMVDTNNHIVDISKKIPKQDAFGCSIDVYKFLVNDLAVIKNELHKIIEVQKDRNQWTEVMLQNLFKRHELISFPCAIGKEKWVEIDNFDDLRQAESAFNEHFAELKDRKIFFIDGDGTLLLGKKPIRGSKEFLEKLVQSGKSFYVMTNNSSKTAAEHAKRFQDIGLPITQDQVLVSSDSLISFLKGTGVKGIFLIANSSVEDHFKAQGFDVTAKGPEALVLCWSTELTYDQLKLFCILVAKGLPYYATHIDIVCPTDEGLVPDIGAFIKLIELTTKRLPDKTFGKPDKSFIEPVLKSHNLSFSDAVVIGDRLYTDIKLAENSKMLSVLVETGETSRIDYESSEIRADMIVREIGELVSHL
ncbi:MAG: HAD-IIA family hydrolase [Candidatus Woesearchaeota archaeon]